jgi:hypothetical protein
VKVVTVIIRAVYTASGATPIADRAAHVQLAEPIVNRAVLIVCRAAHVAGRAIRGLIFWLAELQL